MAVKYKTYVAVFFQDHEGNRNLVKFVTGTERSTALWEKDKPAMPMTESIAKDIVFGLTMNGYGAAVIKVIDGTALWN